MSPTVYCYAVYLTLSVLLTVWVARTLSRAGKVFLADVFHGNEALADAVNHLLVVGFYLINLGYVTLALKVSTRVTEMREGFEVVSTKMGLVLVVLGVLHFFNMYVLTKVRTKSIGQRRIYERTVPVVPSGR